MKMRQNRSKIIAPIAAATISLMAAAGSVKAAVLWTGGSSSGNNGGLDGFWNVSTNWNTSTVPGADDAVQVYGTSAGNPITDITIATPGAGGNPDTPYAAKASSLVISGGNTSIISLADQSSLEVAGPVYSQNGSHVTIQGPANGSATATLGRIYQTKANSTLTLSGKNLTVNLGSVNFTDANNGSVLIITNGVTVNNSDVFYVRNVDSSTNAGSRMTIEGGTVSASKGFSVYNSGLLQLGSGGKIVGTSIEIGKSGDKGRFEAAGTGLDSTSSLHVYDDSGLAIGITPAGGSRTTADTLTLNSTATIDNGGILEMTLFANDDNDRIHFAAGGALTNGGGAGTVLKLLLDNGYTPHANDSWTLFTGTTANITGHFDTSGIDPSKYNLEDFNEAGHWTIRAVPEPGMMLPLGLGGLLLHRKRKQSRA